MLSRWRDSLARLRSPRAAIHQMLVGAVPGDAICDEALLIRDNLRQWGYDSQIYAESIHPALIKEVLPYKSYRCPDRSDDLLLFHHSIGSEICDYVRSLPARLILIYHNITPPEYFKDVDAHIHEQMVRGKRQLEELKDHALLALADSEFNRQELLGVGYVRTGVLPLPFDVRRYQVPPSEEVMKRFGDDSVNLLFVGRIAPNKRQEDVIKVFYYYKRINPRSRLLLVGSSWDPGDVYLKWLQDLVAYLGLADVHFCGHVPFEELVAYYRLADVFVSMSEHEGFCLPLIESMYFGIPIMAYNSTAIPYTLGGTGVLINEKRYDFIAELIELLVTDKVLKQRIVTKQRERLQGFEKEKVVSILQRYIEEAVGAPLAAQTGLHAREV